VISVALDLDIAIAVQAEHVEAASGSVRVFLVSKVVIGVVKHSYMPPEPVTMVHEPMDQRG